VIKFNAKTEGLEQLARMLAKLSDPDFARSAMSDAIFGGAKTIQERAKQLAPVDSGKLKDNIVVKKFGHDYAVIADSPHAHLQEFGTVNHSAKPFMRPGYDEEKTKIIAYVESFLNDKIMEATRD
jgi:HK97 gp10 family phage protein